MANPMTADQVSNLLPPGFDTMINKATESAKKTKVFNETNEQMIKEAEEEKGSPLSFSEKNAIADKAKEQSEVNYQAKTDEAKKITTMTPDEYDKSDLKAVDIVSTLRESGMNDSDIERELRRLNRGNLSDASLAALGMERVPTLAEQTAALNEVESNNPNLEALDQKRKDIQKENVSNKVELEPELQKYNLQAEELIDPKYIEHIPKSLWRDFARGDFGRKKIDEKVKTAYDKIKDIPEDKLTNEQKATIDEYKKQKSERSDARWRFGSLILDALSTGLINIGSYIGGGGPVATSKYEEMSSSKLRGALDRYNKKYSDMANMDTELLNSAYRNDRDIDNQLKKVYADKSVQPYLTKLDLDTRRIFVNYVAAMGKNLNLEDIPGLMAGLWAYQDTGKMNDSTVNLLSQAGSSFMGMLKALIPGV